MIRGLTKTGFAAGMHLLGLDKVIGSRRGMGKMPLVVSYHRVVEDFQEAAAHSIAPMLVSTDTFERHVDWIARHYRVVDLDELGAIMDGTASSKEPVAAITFDDGYADVYWNAYPILKRKGLPATVFVVTDLVGTKGLQAHDEIYLLVAGALSQWSSPGSQLLELINSMKPDAEAGRILGNGIRDPFRVTRFLLESLTRSELSAMVGTLRARVYLAEEVLHEFRAMSWGMLEEMVQNGITVGSHTKTHTLLANESWERILEEVEGSRGMLKEKLGVEDRHFAYPDGCFDGNTVKAVAAAGYLYAYTTCMHRDAGHPLLTIPRRVLWENSSINSFGSFSPSIMSCQINGIFDPASRCEQEHWA